MVNPAHKPSFRQRLSAGEKLVGTIITLSDPAAAQIFSEAGFDWLWLDGEHSAMDFGTIESILRSVGDCHAMVRLPAVDGIWAKKVLDSGAEGIIFPLVNTRALAEKAVALTKYPPLGERNVGIARAQGYGVDFDAYVQYANDWISTIVQIEHIQAVENIDAILSVPGLDALVIGPYDLSASLGIPGKVDAPEVRRAIDHVLQTCHLAGKPIGIFAANGDRAQQALEQGFDFIAVGTDVMFLGSAASGVRDRLRPNN